MVYQKMMFAELSQTQLDFLNSKKIQRDLKELDYGTAKRHFNQ